MVPAADVKVPRGTVARGGPKKAGVRKEEREVWSMSNGGQQPLMREAEAGCAQGASSVNAQRRPLQMCAKRDSVSTGEVVDARERK